jgi:DNA polymerase-1
MVPTCGPKDAKVAFVSRSPGKYDVRAQKPFGGPSGKVLDHLLNQHGVTRDSIITTNVVLCQTDDPPTKAIRACKPRLDEDIKHCELIIAGGSEATNALTPYKGVTRARGFSIKRGNQRVVVTNNPAVVWKKSDAYPDIVKDFRRAFNPLPPPVFPKVEIIDDDSTARAVLERWIETPFETPIASDLEWAGKRIECCGFSKDGKKAVVLGSSGISSSRNQSLLKRFYERSDIRFIWHNGKDDTKVLRRNSIEGRVDEDTFLMSYALDERPGYHKLEYLLSEHFGWPDYEPASVKHFKSHGEFDPKVPLRKAKYELYKYNGWDTAGTRNLYTTLYPSLDTDNVLDLYNRLLLASQAFVEVELNGFHYNIEEACNIQEREVYPRLWDYTEDMQLISEHPLLNPNSVPQMHAIYYNEWQLKHKLRDTGKKKLSKSTGKEVREEIYADRFECKPLHKKRVKLFAETHTKYAKVQRVSSNYLIGLIKKVQEDGKLYCRFNIGGTVTGRTSSSEPNFQNITREGVEGIPGIRNLFLPSRGHVIISVDYSQAELRTCAKLSGDDRLLAIYRDSNRSLHKERAAAFYGDNYTKEEYVKSKNINFGVTYLQSAASFAQMYHMPEKEAQAYIDSWWSDFPQLKKWTQQLANQGLKEGYVQSPFGHKRRFHLITDENIGELRREAVNFLPQNIAAWLTICSIIDLVNSGVRVVATVHDSIVADVPVEQVRRVVELFEQIMVSQPIKQLGWQPDDIPFSVDISIGPSWGEQEEYGSYVQQNQRVA